MSQEHLNADLGVEKFIVICEMLHLLPISISLAEIFDFNIEMAQVSWIFKL